jgi:hypothetical protein
MISWLRRLLCRHVWRDSTSWPGMVVCKKCGQRRIVG